MSEWDKARTEAAARQANDCLPDHMRTISFYVPDGPPDVPPQITYFKADKIESDSGFYKLSSYAFREKPFADKPSIFLGSYIDQPLYPRLPNRHTYEQARRLLQQLEQQRTLEGWNEAPSDLRDRRDHYSNYPEVAKPCAKRQPGTQPKVA